MFKLVKKEEQQIDGIRTVLAEIESESGRKYYLSIEPSYIMFDDCPPDEQKRLFDEDGNYSPLEAFDRVDGIPYYKPGFIEGTDLAYRGSIVEDIIDELIAEYQI